LSEQVDRQVGEQDKTWVQRIVSEQSNSPATTTELKYWHHQMQQAHERVVNAYREYLSAKDDLDEARASDPRKA
jgi:hypothetical protein